MTIINQTATIYVAIDPGNSGAFAVLDDNGIRFVEMPGTDLEVVELVRSFKLLPGRVEFWLEDPCVGGWKIQSKSSIAVFFGKVGILYGAIVGNGFPVHRVRPQRWQKAIGFAGSKLSYKERKAALYAKAKELMPEAPVDKDNADACLILYAAMRGLLD